MLHVLATQVADDPGVAHRWHGRRVFAVDGAKINLQRSPDLHDHFGTPSGAYCPQMLVSVMLDVCSKLPVDVAVPPSASSEREHLLEMSASLAAGDVLTMDRGYPSHEVLQDLAEAGIDFLVRVPVSNTFAVIDELREGSRNDIDCSIDPPEGSPQHWKPLQLRAVRTKAPDGSESFFLTTLGRTEFDRGAISEPYHMRWEVEEHFKLLQGAYIGQGQLRSKSPLGVRQDLDAAVLFISITRLCMMSAADTSGAEYESLSQKAAILGFATYVTRVFLPADTEQVRGELQHLIRRILRNPQPRRPGRSFPRRSMKPGPRWGPAGRRGA